MTSRAHSSGAFDRITVIPSHTFLELFYRLYGFPKAVVIFFDGWSIYLRSLLCYVELVYSKNAERDVHPIIGHCVGYS